MARMRILLTMLIACIVALFIRLATLDPNAGKMKNRPAPDLAIPLQNKPVVHISDLKGKVVLLDFWATWCGPCRQSIPELVSLYNKYHDKGLEVIGLSMDLEGERQDVPKVVEYLKMTYPIAYGRDIQGIEEQYKAEHLPTLYIIDKQGNIADAREGYDPSDSLEPVVRQLLER